MLKHCHAADNNVVDTQFDQLPGHFLKVRGEFALDLGKNRLPSLIAHPRRVCQPQTSVTVSTLGHQRGSLKTNRRF